MCGGGPLFDEMEETQQTAERDMEDLVKKVDAAYNRVKNKEAEVRQMVKAHKNYDHRLKCMWDFVSGCEGRLEKKIEQRGDQYSRKIQGYADSYDRIESAALRSSDNMMQTRLDLERRVHAFGKTLKTLAAEKASATNLAEHKVFVRNKMSTLEKAIHADNKARAAQIEKVQGQVNSLADAIKDQTSPTNGRLDEIVQGFEAQLADIRQRLDDTRPEAPQAAVLPQATLNAADDARVASLSEAVGVHDQWFGEVARRITDHESRILECQQKQPGDVVVPEELTRRVDGIASRVEWQPQREEEKLEGLRAEMLRRQEEQFGALRADMQRQNEEAQGRLRQELALQKRASEGQLRELEGKLAEFYDDFVTGGRTMASRYEALRREHEALQADHDQLKSDCTQLKEEEDQLKLVCAQLKAEHDQLQSDCSQACNQLQAACDQLKTEHVELKDDHLEVAQGQFQLKVDLRTRVEGEPERLNKFGDKLYKEFMDVVEESEADLYKEVMEKMKKAVNDAQTEVIDQLHRHYGPALPKLPGPVTQPSPAPA